jgi:hypothetical protein
MVEYLPSSTRSLTVERAAISSMPGGASDQFAHRLAVELHFPA